MMRRIFHSQWSNVVWAGLTMLAVALMAACGGPKYPKCEKDKDCKDKEFCVQGMCQQCRYQSDCPLEQDCNAGRCEPAKNFCRTNAQCPPDQHCIQFRCVPRPDAKLGAAMSTEDPNSRANETCYLEPVYFAFDSDHLDDAAKKALDNNAKCVQQRKLDTVRITGHTDPRGTEEYNLALGDRRARSTAGYLRALIGGDKVQIPTTSVGEEMARGTDETTWAQDRKADVQSQ
jgi:peptidoglycan-associated lipoprotein